MDRGTGYYAKAAVGWPIAGLKLIGRVDKRGVFVDGSRLQSPARRAWVRHPGAITAALVRTFDGDAVAIEPQRHRTASPRVDPVDDRHPRPTAKPGRHLTDDRVDAAAFKRQRGLAGDDRDRAAARRVKARRLSAVEPAFRSGPGFRPVGESLARLFRKKRARHTLALVARDK